MESTKQQQTTGSKGVSVIGALAGMLVTFVAGIYVGLHPAWIPVPVSTPNSTNEMPPANMAGDTHSPATMPATKP